MRGKENQPQEVARILDGCINEVLKSGIKPAEDLARDYIRRINKHELIVLSTSPQLQTPSISGFSLIPVNGARTQYSPAIVVDMDRVLTTDRKIIEGDLVRTLAVVSQVPNKGFQRRLKTVCTDAFEPQIEWLLEMDIPPLEFDPRTTDWDNLTRTFLGPERYLLDVGFNDWQKAVRNRRAESKKPADVFYLDQLEHADNFFMAMREFYVSRIYEAVMKTFGDQGIKDYDEDRRARDTADCLVEFSLNSRQPNN